MQAIDEAYGALSGPKIRVFNDKMTRYRKARGSHIHRENRHTLAERNRVKRAIILLLALAGLILFTSFAANLQQPDYSFEDEAYDVYEEDMTQNAKDSGRLPAVPFCTVVTIRDTYGYEPDLRSTVGFISDGTELIIVPGQDYEWAKIRNRTYGDFIRVEDVEIISCQEGAAAPTILRSM
ncbi:MAG: hypothetical protein L0154_28190 [Chloroflexi bacterium]|nr:hypothetical protein [Chloroflexota bacterium]